MNFKHQVIDPDPPGSQHDITLLFDITGSGTNDVFIAGKSGELFWYENPGWKRHVVGNAPEIEAGGVVVDIAGNGRLDVVAGQQYNGNELYWFEHPQDPGAEWPRRIITGRFTKYHDQTAGDINGDGRPEILFTSQLSGILGFYTIPEDPRTEPWPEENFHMVCEDFPDTEGLVVADIDGDGTNEILAGPNIFKAVPGGEWERTCLADDYVMTRAAVGDIDGDGQPEIILVEGESNPGRLAICHAPDWRPVVLKEGLFHPHSLALADFTGDGSLDIFTAEMGLGKNENPHMYIFANQGQGTFEEHLICEGIPTHEAKVADMTGNGRPDIVGKPYEPERHIDLWINTGRGE